MNIEAGRMRGPASLHGSVRRKCAARPRLTAAPMSSSALGGMLRVHHAPASFSALDSVMTLPVTFLSFLRPSHELMRRLTSMARSLIFVVIGVLLVVSLLFGQQIVLLQHGHQSV